MIKVFSFPLLCFVLSLPLYLNYTGFSLNRLETRQTETLVCLDWLAKEHLILDKILSELYLTASITNVNFGKPTIELSEVVKTAKYVPKTNKIIVGTKLIKFATSYSILKKETIYRFVIGHEFGHYVQMVIDKIGFTQKSAPCLHTEMSERDADFYAVFTNMLNGDTEIKQDAKMIISAVYAYFEPDTFCYPPLEDRLKSSETAIAKAQYLHHLFKTANYLTAAEEYDFALDIYEHLLQHYGGAEFYNNKGILLLMRGIEKNTRNSKEYKRFFFPIELDLSTKLKIVKDDEDLNFIKYIDTADFIEAEKAFEKARSVGGQEGRYLRNRLSALILQREFAMADSLLQECIGDDNLKELLRALLLLQKDSTDKTGIELLKSLAGNENHLSELAEMNLIVLEKRELQAPSDFPTVCVPVEEIYLSRGQVAAMEAKHLSDAEYIESISINGIYTVIKQKTGRQILVQTLSAAQTCDAVAVRHYPVSNYGLNFTAHSYTDEGNIRNKVVFLDEQTAAVVTEL